MAHSMDRYFAPPEGRIFACFPGAEDRPGQRRMAELVHNTVMEGGARFQRWRDGGSEPEARPEAVIQAVEAGTGTGKSLGYLVPALAAGHHPILVATRTKQLQRQLLEEDVPRAAGILGRPIKAVLAKGRANYLCRTAWEAAGTDPHLEFTRADQQLWLALQRWTLETQDGDREGLAQWLAERMDRGESLAFALGSSHGFDPSLKKEIREQMSLSPMTFPHELSRVMFLEQLYRAFTIIRGKDYHK